MNHPMTSEILSAQITQRDIDCAREFLERFGYSTTALRALGLAIAELEHSLGDECPVGRAVADAVTAIAAVEAGTL